MNHVVNPSLALLHAETSPLRLGHQVGLGNEFRDFFGQHDVPVLEIAIKVFVRIVDVVVRHGYCLRRLCPHDDEGQCVPPTESYGKTIKSGTEREVFLA